MLRKLLEVSRFLLILPVIGSLLLTIGIVVMGLGMVLSQAWDLLSKCDFSAKAGKQLTITAIATIDMFLVGAISYIIAVGLYRLFISQDEVKLLERIKIEKLEDLENKIIGVVIVALAVGFLGEVVQAVDAQAAFYGGIGVAVVIGALSVFVKFSGMAKE